MLVDACGNCDEISSLLMYIDPARRAGGDVKQWKQRSEDGGTGAPSVN